MSTQPPTISRLNPVVMPDNRRVTMEMTVDNLPGIPTGSGNVISFFDTPPPATGFNAPGSSPGSAPEDSPAYPNIELSILDGDNREIASLLIVEHKEPRTALTLHLRAPNLDPAGQFTARAEMTLNDEVLEVVEIPFTLHPSD